jgi:hypothetical protein
MTKTGCVKRGLFAAVLVFVSAPVMAQEVADIHEQRRERGSVCFTDHYHYGSSSGVANKKAAQAAAIKSWADFVNFEYGGAWTSWARSGSKSVKCSQAGIGGAWSCDVSSRPCRGGR